MKYKTITINSRNNQCRNQHTNYPGETMWAVCYEPWDGDRKGRFVSATFLRGGNSTNARVIKNTEFFNRHVQ